MGVASSIDVEHVGTALQTGSGSSAMYVCGLYVCVSVCVNARVLLTAHPASVAAPGRNCFHPRARAHAHIYHSTHMTVLPTDNLGVGGGHAVNSQCYNYFPALLLRSTRLCLMQVCKTNHTPRLLRRHLTKQLPADRTSKRHVTCNQCTHVNCIGRCVAATCQGSISHNKGL